MKEKKAPEFPTQGAAAGRLKKLAEFHKYLMELVLFPDRDYDHKTMALKKPGAEKIAFILKLVADYELLDIGGQFDVEVATRKVKCKLFNSESRLVAVGLGECNTTEKKSTNAVLKIAKKRAYVDAVIAVACLSGVFTQDIEDKGAGADLITRREYAREDEAPTAVELSADEPESAGVSGVVGEDVSGEAGPNIFTQTEDEPNSGVDQTIPERLGNPDRVRRITQRQANFLFAEARDKGQKTREEVTGAISSLGLKGTHEIPFDRFDDWLDWARGRLSMFDLADRMKGAK